ncbi:MAG: response regulator receiver protein [Rhodospirillales bacterium]|nr:response regulator receiver protein [Rhodospirillales bacterium]
MSTEPNVFIVDDDDAVRESLGALLESHGFTVVTFPSALHFLARCDRAASGCLVADVRMPDMDGLELQEKVAADFPDLGVVIITGHGDVPIAVRAMKAGAVDFVEKPFLEDLILETVRQAIEHAARSRRHHFDITLAMPRLALLTPREREILDALVAGMPNKTIGYDLGISARTVEIHRARVMEKMQVRSLSALVRIAIAAGIVPS